MHFKSYNAIPQVFTWKLSDVDDIGRVLEVRAWLEGQGFYDLANHRSNPPLGGDMHWSRIADVPLALTQLILRLFMNNQEAEKWGVLITPQWLFITYCALAVKLAHRFCDNQFLPIIFLLLVITNEVLQSNFYPGRVDHHGLQLIFLMICLYGAIFDDFWHSFLSGAGLAVGIAIGFELLPMQILIVGFFTILWWLDAEKYKNKITGFVTGLGIFIILGLFADVAPLKFTEGANDRLSVATMIPILVGCLGLWLLTILDGQINSKNGLLKRAIMLLAAAILVIAAAFQFPILFRGLYWQIDPNYYHFWMDDCADCTPLVTRPFFIELKYGYFIFAVTIAIIVKLLFSIVKKDETNIKNWSLLMVLMVANCLLTFFYQARIMGQASAIAIIIATALITEAFTKQTILRACLIAIALFPAWANIYQSFTQKNDRQKTNYESMSNNSNCYSNEDYAHLAKLPKGLVAANLNISSELLINTHHNVLATGFHRDLGRNLLYPILLANDNDAKSKINALGVNYIAYCRASQEIIRIKTASPDGLMSHLLAGKIPNYLIPVKPVNNSDIIVYEVVK